MFAYEQCLLVLGHHPDVWYEAAQYLDQSSKLLAEKGVREATDGTMCPNWNRVSSVLKDTFVILDLTVIWFLNARLEPFLPLLRTWTTLRCSVTKQLTSTSAPSVLYWRRTCCCTFHSLTTRRWAARTPIICHGTLAKNKTWGHNMKMSRVAKEMYNWLSSIND